jgi:hypothetical protein
VVVVAADDQNVAMMFLPLPVLFLPAFVVEDHNMAVMVSIPISIPVSVVISIADANRYIAFFRYHNWRFAQHRPSHCWGAQ